MTQDRKEELGKAMFSAFAPFLFSKHTASREELESGMINQMVKCLTEAELSNTDQETQDVLIRVDSLLCNLQNEGRNVTPLRRRVLNLIKD